MMSHGSPPIHAFKFVIRARKMQAWLGRIAANAVIAGILVAIVPMGLRGQSADEVEGLNKQIVQLYGQGWYAEATATALQALALAERTLGMEHPQTLFSVNNLAALYLAQGRYVEAEPLSNAQPRRLSKKLRSPSQGSARRARCRQAS